MYFVPNPIDWKEWMQLAFLIIRCTIIADKESRDRYNESRILNDASLRIGKPSCDTRCEYYTINWKVLAANQNSVISLAFSKVRDIKFLCLKGNIAQKIPS